jgi:2-succinyl-5-enolpyruvyl-6-hydroxy-3-cyclohexene-1-carboxylate synthase
LLSSPEIARRYAPDVVLHLGGQYVSKRLGEFIGRSRPKEYIIVQDHPYRRDPYHRATRRVEGSIAQFAKILKGYCDTYRACSDCDLYDLSQRAEKVIDQGGSTALTEISAVRAMTQQLEQGDALFLSSSLSIRHVNTFGAADTEGVVGASNRAASGIDGVIASAVGFAQGAQRPTTLLIGDHAFLYDLNSLSLVNTLRYPFRIVLLNNNGGGIFSFLPIANCKKVLKSHFQAPHNLTFEHAAQLFGLSYSRPSSLKEFNRAYTLPQSCIIEVVSTPEETLAENSALQDEINTLFSSTHELAPVL